MPIEIHGKKYITVAERVTAFHEQYPQGMIETDIKLNGETVLAKSTIYPDANNKNLFYTGWAEEDRKTGINKTSAVCNAETSAVGRALGFLGLGSLESIASADEVQNAVAKDEMIDRLKDAGLLKEKGKTVGTICDKCGLPMKERTRASDGSKFLGCSGFPSCKNVVSIKDEKPPLPKDDDMIDVSQIPF